MPTLPRNWGEHQDLGDAKRVKLSNVAKVGDVASVVEFVKMRKLTKLARLVKVAKLVNMVNVVNVSAEHLTILHEQFPPGDLKPPGGHTRTPCERSSGLRAISITRKASARVFGRRHVLWKNVFYQEPGSVPLPESKPCESPASTA